MQFKKIIVAGSVTFAASMATAESTPKVIDLVKLYGRFEKPDIRP